MLGRLARSLAMAIMAPVVWSSWAEAAAPATQPGPAAVTEAIQRGVAYLLAGQAEDGSWGRGEAKPVSIPNAQSGLFPRKDWIDCYRLASTCLVYQALLRTADPADPKVAEALTRVEAHLLKRVKEFPGRNPAKVLDQLVWANPYSIFAMIDLIARRGSGPEVDQARDAIAARVQIMVATQHRDGGWHYMNQLAIQQVLAQANPFGKRRKQGPTDFDRSPSASFVTAVYLLALKRAGEHGATVDQAVLDRAGKLIQSLKRDAGGFAYQGSGKKPRPKGAPKKGPAKKSKATVKETLGRTMLCLLALKELGLAGPDELREAVRQFLEHHAELEKVYGLGGSHHEKYYGNASYYYLFGYCYAAEAARTLGDDEAAQSLRAVIAKSVLSHQNKDGSWNDCPNLGKAYGTAMALLALGREPSLHPVKKP
jgi:hypothetical protein